MEAFLDYMLFVCFSFGIIGLIIGGWVYLGEYILEKFNLTDKFINFMLNTNDEED